MACRAYTCQITTLSSRTTERIKRVVRPRLGFKSFRSARQIIAGYEIMQMIRKGQLRASGQLRPAQQTYASGCDKPIDHCGPLLAHTDKFATCVDARFGARKIFWIALARSRVLTCVRPHECSGSHAAGPYGSSRIGSKSEPRAFKHSVANWFSRSHLADYCAILSV